MRDGMGLDGAVIRSVADGLADSAGDVERRAHAFRAAGFGADAVGDRYRSEAEAVQACYDGLHRAVVEWSAATAARASALRRATGEYAWLDQETDSVLRGVDMPPTASR
ncbi:hypothetical protein QYS60_22670 [Rhodococcus sp. GXMU-t2271]|uniref:hypothetical protein n=1 Tax=Rhodococcus sp. GXMU-t2271 TaxID=3059079 RepID=UPI00352A6248